MVTRIRGKKYEVKANLQVPILANAGSSLKLPIYLHKEKIGEVIIGGGSLYWHGRKRQRSKRISWTAFADMMDELAYGTKNPSLAGTRPVLEEKGSRNVVKQRQGTRNAGYPGY